MGNEGKGTTHLARAGGLIRRRKHASLRKSDLAGQHDPLRGDIFSADHLEEFASQLAGSHRVYPGRRKGYPLLSRVWENGRALHAAYLSISQAVQADRSISPAAEWLMDNFHVVDEQLREIREHLPKGYYLDLPKLAEGDLKGFPRVYGLVAGYIAHTDSRVDEEVLRRFVRSYQRVQALTIGELWAVAITLRVALIENLRRLADWVVGGRQARLQADWVADRLLGLYSSESDVPSPEPQAEVSKDALEDVWEAFEDSPFFPAFAVQLFQRLHDQEAAGLPALVWLEEQLEQRGLSGPEIVQLEHQRQAAVNVSVRNIITSMRLALELDWKEFFEAVSLVETALRTSSGYAEMDFASRDLYRHALEDLAKGARRPELETATRALEHGAAAAGIDGLNRGGDVPRRASALLPIPAYEPEAAAPAPVGVADLGRVLIGEERGKFEAAIGYRSPMGKALGRKILGHALFAYPASVLALTVVFGTIGLEVLQDGGASPLTATLLALLGAFPLSEGALALVNRCVTALFPARILPKLELAEGIPTRFRTLVAIPALLRNLIDVQDLAERLEVHFLANPDGDIRFALLTDWPDAPEEQMPGDDALLNAGREAIADLNARHGAGPGEEPRFLFLHRRRIWNPREGRWMGWERKRGKLHELNRLLRGAGDTTFLPSVGQSPVPDGVRYVITLDSDTRMPKGLAARLVGTLAHPLNQPRFDPAKGRVVAGHGILQPRITPTLPSPQDRTLYHWSASGRCGIDPYASAVSDVYQDLFDQGS